MVHDARPLSEVGCGCGTTTMVLPYTQLHRDNRSAECPDHKAAAQFVILGAILEKPAKNYGMT